MLRLNERRDDYIDVSSKQERLEKKKSVLGRVREYVSSKAAAVLTMAAVLGGVNEAKADTGTVDDIRFDRNITGVGSPTLDMKSGGFTLEATLQSGGVVEINQNYSAKIRFGSNKRDLQFIDNSGTVVATHTFQDDINILNPITSLGNDEFLLETDGGIYFFKGADIGTQSGVVFRESTLSFKPRIVTHLNKHPQTGNVVGVTLLGEVGNPAIFFSYGTGDFSATHPFAGSDVLVNQALTKIGALDANGQRLPYSLASSVIDGNVVFAVEDANGNHTEWINPETDEVVPPTPVINVDPSFSLNQEKMVSGKELVANVTDVPENGSVVLNIDGVEFVMTEFASGRFVKSFSAQELTQFANGEFSKVAMVNVKDGSGKVLASADVNMEIDIVAPNVEFGIDGATIEDMNGSKVSVIESVEIPAEITVGWESSEVAGLGPVYVASIPLINLTMVEFAGKTVQEQMQILLANVSLPQGEGAVFLSGSLGELIPVNPATDTSATLKAQEGDHVVAMIARDPSGNWGVSMLGLEVRQIEETCEVNPDQDKCTPVEVSCDEDPSQDKCEPVEESCEVNPDQAKCAPVEVSCDEDPSQDKCEVEEPKPPVNPETPGGDEEGGGCAVPGSAPAAPGKAPLALFGIMAALGLVRKKRQDKEGKR